MGTVSAYTSLGTIAVIISPGIGALIGHDTEAGTVQNLQFRRFSRGRLGGTVAAGSIYLFRFTVRRIADLA